MLKYKANEMENNRLMSEICLRLRPRKWSSILSQWPKHLVWMAWYAQWPDKAW